MNNPIGNIELIIGPMYAGKSTELLKEIHKYKFLNKKLLIINHTINKRYGTDKIITHDQISCKDSISLEKIVDIYDLPNFEEADIIIIEEVQFFNDAYEEIQKLADIYHKKIICAGLSGDFRKKSFGDVCKLIPIADKITHLRAMCSICRDGTPASFTKRCTSSQETELVGANDIYKAVCRYHHLHDE
jgi:thymidine kinase